MEWLRRIRPWGLRYELFDVSVQLVWVALVNYVLTRPPTSTREALAEPGEMALGTVVALAAVIGVLCSMQKTTIRLGYVVVISAAGALGFFLLWGVLNSHDPRTVSSALIFLGWSSRLVREFSRYNHYHPLGGRL